MTDPGRETPGTRLLAVLAALAEAEALSHEAVQQATGLPRSAAYRALVTLEDAGWVRRRLSDGAFRLVTASRARMGLHPGTGALTDRVAPVLAQLARHTRIVAEVGVFTAPGTFRMTETTRRDGPPFGPEEFFAAPVVRAALAVTPAERRLTHVRAAMEDAGEDERREVTTGRFTRAVASAARAGSVWDPDTQSLCLPLDGGELGAGAVRLEGGGATRRSENRLRGLAADLAGDLPGLIPTAQEILQRHWGTGTGTGAGS